MSDDKKAAPPAESDPSVIEGEILEEAEASTREPEPSAKTGQHGQEQDPAPKSHGSAKPVRKGSIWGRAGWVLALLLAVFIGGVIAEPHLRPTLVKWGLEPAPPSTAQSETIPSDFIPKLAALEAKITDLTAATDRLEKEALATPDTSALTAAVSDLESRIAAVESMASSGLDGPAPGALADVSQFETRQDQTARQVEQLQEGLTRLQADLDRITTADPRTPERVSRKLAALRTLITEQSATIEALEAGLLAASDRALQDSPRGRLVLSLSEMRESALAGEPLGPELSAARAHVATLSPAVAERLSLALDSLERALSPPPPALATLTESFDRAAADALTARDAAEKKFLAGLFISRDTSASATGLDALLNQAERRLIARDLAGASEVLLEADGAAADALRHWRQDADRLIRVLAGVDQAVEILSSGRFE